MSIIFEAIRAKSLGESTHAIIIWPATFAGYRAAAVQDLIYGALGVRARITLPSMHREDLRQLVVRTYCGEAFIGSHDDGFRFSRDKTGGVWRESDVTEVFLVRGQQDRILELKSDVRNLCRVGRHAIHSTDTAEELHRVWHASRLMYATGFQEGEIRLK